MTISLSCAAVRVVAQSFYDTLSKDSMEADKRRLTGDTVRSKITDEGTGLRHFLRDLKRCVVNINRDNRLLKKSMIGLG